MPSLTSGEAIMGRFRRLVSLVGIARCRLGGGVRPDVARDRDATRGGPGEPEDLSDSLGGGQLRRGLKAVRRSGRRHAGLVSGSRSTRCCRPVGPSMRQPSVAVPADSVYPAGESGGSRRDCLRRRIQPARWNALRTWSVLRGHVRGDAGRIVLHLSGTAGGRRQLPHPGPAALRSLTTTWLGPGC